MLRDQMAKQGVFLFRWRSFLPLLLIPLAAVAMLESDFFERQFGETAENLWDVGCVLVSFAGLGIRMFTVGFVPAGTSGRNTRDQRADVLNTTGIYSTVRNPLYLGNFLMLIGAVLAIQVWWFVVIVTFLFWIYYERIIAAEEAFLAEKYGKTYTDWASETPVILPDLKRWRKPAMAFSWRTVFRREYNGIYLITVLFLVIEFLQDVVYEGQSIGDWLRGEYGWAVLFGVGTLVFFTLRTLKKHTNVLAVDGR